jgi:hypothetical protein
MPRARCAYRRRVHDAPALHDAQPTGEPPGPRARRGPAAPRCPIRDGDPCSLCVPGASGPQDCGLVYLVTSDPELREQWNARRRSA